MTDETMGNDSRIVLLTGATGYVGGRLLKLLEECGVQVRCLARRPEYLKEKVTGSTQVVGGDLLDQSSLDASMQGVDTAYYLVHSLGSSGNFEELERRGAVNFGRAAQQAGVRKVIYLGGLGDSTGELSPHLRSRKRVGEVLRSFDVPVVEFRASVVIGSGSTSYEMIRALVERLPVMITPKWVSTMSQPIAVNDLLNYLVAALDLNIDSSHVYEVGGSDVVSYRQMMAEYARQRGLKRYMIPVPVLTPRLSSLWLGLVTPVYSRIGRKLIDSLRHPSLVKNHAAMEDFKVQPMNISDSIAQAISNEDREFAQTRWSDAQSSSGDRHHWGGVKLGSRLVVSKSVHTNVAPEVAFGSIQIIGGDIGWDFTDWLWKLRGLIDLAVGGVGVRRGRRDPENIVLGDTLDWWRVEAYEPCRRLLLYAEMRTPGRAWLEFRVEAAGSGSTIYQTAVFEPLGVAGLAYWYGLYPIHKIVFSGMLRNLAKQAVARSYRT